MRNPYQPPAAAVSDVADAGVTARPAGVTLAVRLLWATMVVGFVLSLFDVRAALGGRPDIWLALGVTAALYAFVFGICYWIFGAILAGRNWARILHLVLTLLWLIAQISIVVMLQSLPEIPADTIGNLLINAGQFVVTAVAMALLFTPSANRWYRAVRDARR